MPKLNDHQPIKNVAQKPTAITFTDAEGNLVREKRSRIRFKRKMIDIQGNVIWVSLSSGAAAKPSFKRNEYGQQIWDEKLKAGFLPYTECPVAKGYVQVGAQKPCKGTDGKGAFSNEECCPHLLRIIERRRVAYAKTASRFNDKFRTQTDEMIDLLKQQARRQLATERDRDAGPLAVGPQFDPDPMQDLKD